jgi:hypothetical protein
LFIFFTIYITIVLIIFFVCPNPDDSGPVKLDEPKAPRECTTGTPLEPVAKRHFSKVFLECSLRKLSKTAMKSDQTLKSFLFLTAFHGYTDEKDCL